MVAGRSDSTESVFNLFIRILVCVSTDMTSDVKEVSNLYVLVALNNIFRTRCEGGE
jgi:hypothetical protein